MRTLAIAVSLLAASFGQGNRDSHPAGAHVDIGGTRLWVEQEGSGEPLLLIAGGPGLSHAYFHPWFDELRDRFRVIYFDGYGTGQSDRAAKPSSYSFVNDVANVEALRQALKLGPMNVLGHSYGGMVALAYADKYPASVRRLIIANSVASGDELQLIQNHWNDQFSKQMPEAWKTVQALRSKGMRASAAEHQQAYAMPGTLLFFRDASNASKQSMADPNLYNADVWYGMGGDDADFTVRGDLRPFDMRTRAAHMRMPMLIIAGRFDRVVYPELAVRFREYAPRAKFVMFEDAGHFTFLEAPAATLALLRAFLTQE